MDQKKKEGRYIRLVKQLKELCNKEGNPLTRMATIAAVLHHKMDYFFWTGFYLYEDDRLLVGPYQGPVACQELEYHTGVCWAALKSNAAVIVPDVTEFPGHIACDSRSQSEIALPVKDETGNIKAVFDVDSSQRGQFDKTDEKYLYEIISFIHQL